ncbi:MAG: hypothetical protein HY905_01540 [Deltaproteobacteria bacterium]|nr:hypothetical protein [Deltaproteobacteria bacterium]
MKHGKWMLLLALVPMVAACGDDSGGSDVATDDAAADDGAGADADADADADMGADADAEPDAEVEEEADAEVTSDESGDEATGETTEDAGDEVADDGGPPPPDWSCLGSVTWATPTETSLDMTGTVLDYVTDAPIEGATVKVCARSDAACATPLDEGTTDALGQVTLTVPLGTTGFDGYFDVSATGYVTVLRYTVEPITEMPPEAGRIVSMADTTTFAMLAAAAGVTPDPTRGHLVISALDCNPTYAAGVSLEVDTADVSSTAVYMIGGLPSTSATETDSSGAAGFINLPAGAATISTTLVSTGEAIASTDITIRAGTAALFPLPPTP